MRVISSTAEFALIHAQNTTMDDPQLRAEAEEVRLANQGLQQLDQALSRLKTRYDSGYTLELHDRTAKFEHLRASAEEIKRISKQFFNSTNQEKQKNSLNFKEHLESAESNFFRAIEDLMLREDHELAHSRNDLRRSLLGSLNQAAVVGLALLSLSALYGIGFAASISRPIQKLQDKVKETRNGVFHRRLFINSRDEVGELARDFEKMIEEILTARDHAESANRAKSDFLANVSHELRTPLNAILGTTHLMLSGELAEAQKEDISNIDRAARRLLTMINATIDFSLVRAGELKLSAVPFNLKEVVRSVTAPLKTRAVAKGLTFNLELDEEIPNLLLGDPHRFNQVLDAVVRNAVKFTNKGDIGVRLKWHSKHGTKSSLLIDVSDTGIGIPSDKIEKLFSPFAQADYSSTRKFEGIGIGLALASHLIELMGGKISFESELNKGSIFKIEVPLSEALSDNTTSKNSACVDSKEPAITELKNPALNILVVEDNIVNQKLLERILKKAGHSVTLANNGKEALQNLERVGYFTSEKSHGQFDVVLMDIQMPEMNGVEATTTIRSREHTLKQHIPIIAVTAHALSKHRDEYCAAGMDDFIAKPIDVKLLNQALAKVIESKWT